MKNRGELVSKEISSDELCLRCIYHPLHFSESNNKLKREALLPPPNRNDVSLLRMRYMSIEKCVQHGQDVKMGENHFVAIASVTRKDVLTNNKWAMMVDEKGNTNGTSADIYYAPMHNNRYVNCEIDVYVDDSDCNLPAHSDLRYDANLVKGTVQTRMRQYASQLVKKMNIVYPKDLHSKSSVAQ